VSGADRGDVDEGGKDETAAATTTLSCDDARGPPAAANSDSCGRRLRRRHAGGGGALMSRVGDMGRRLVQRISSLDRLTETDDDDELDEQQLTAQHWSDPSPLFPNREQKVCRYSRHIAGSQGWPFPLLKYQYIFIPAKAFARDYVITGVGLSVCLSVCLLVTTITK